MARRLSVAVPPPKAYPYPTFPKAVLNAAVKALRRAWAPIAEEERKCRVGEERTEIQLNAELAAELDALRRSGKMPGFTPDEFETPVVDAPTKDYTGKSLGHRPDITIRMRNVRPGVADPMVDAIFVECKRLRHGTNLGSYFNSGMQRFLKGEYAWAVQEAIMVGYVETDQELPASLQERLQRMGKGQELQVLPDEKGRPVRPSGQRYLAFTRHLRTWAHQNADAPGSIELLHVWLWQTD